MPELINIPEEITCIQPYVLTASCTVATLIILYLVRLIKEKDKNYKDAILNHMNDLKNHSKSIEAITQKDATLVVDNLTKFNNVIESLKNQITKLQTILSNSK